MHPVDERPGIEKVSPVLFDVAQPFALVPLAFRGPSIQRATPMMSRPRIGRENAPGRNATGMGGEGVDDTRKPGRGSSRRPVDTNTDEIRVYALSRHASLMNARQCSTIAVLTGGSFSLFSRSATTASEMTWLTCCARPA